MSDVINLDDPSYWCRRMEGSLRDIARSLRRFEESVVEVRIRPEGETKERAKRNVDAYFAFTRGSARKLLQHLDELEKRLP